MGFDINEINRQGALEGLSESASESFRKATQEYRSVKRVCRENLSEVTQSISDGDKYNLVVNRVEGESYGEWRKATQRVAEELVKKSEGNISLLQRGFNEGRIHISVKPETGTSVFLSRLLDPNTPQVTL